MSNIPAGFEVDEEAIEAPSGVYSETMQKVPEGFEIDEVEKPVDVYQREYVDPAVRALPDSGMERFAVDVGRGAYEIGKGVQQLGYLAELKYEKNKLDKIVSGQEFYDKENKVVRKPTSAEIKKAEDDYFKLEEKYKAFTDDFDAESAMYYAGTKDREWSSLFGRVVGSAAALPIPGGGSVQAGKTGWALFMEISKRVAAEGGLGGVAAGLDYVPEDMSRTDNILFGAFLGTMMKGGEIALRPTVNTVKNFFTEDGMPSEKQIQEFSEWLRTQEEAQESVDVLLDSIDEDWVNRQLQSFPQEEIADLPQAAKERLAVFEFMRTEPTQGQILRDPHLMSQEIQMSKDPVGKGLWDRFADQAKAGKEKLLSLTGQNPRANFGNDLIDAFQELRKEWTAQTKALYDKALENADLNKRFSLSAFTSKIDELENKINTSDKVLGVLKDINKYLEKDLALPEQASQINKSMQGNFGDNAIGQMYKMMELVKLKGGLNAAEFDLFITKTINGWSGHLSGEEKRMLSELRSASLVDVIDGTGEDAFRQARKSHSEMMTLIEEYPILEQLGFYKKGKAPKDVISPDEAMRKFIINANERDFNRVMDLLDTPEYQAQLGGLKESLRENIFKIISDKAMSGALDVNNKPTFNMAAYNSVLNDLTKRRGMEGLKRAGLSDEDVMVLGMIKRYGEYLAEPSSGTKVTKFNPSGSGAQAITNLLNWSGRTPAARTFMEALRTSGSFLNNMAERVQVRESLEGRSVPRRLQQIQGAGTPPTPLMPEPASDALSGILYGTGVTRPSQGIATGVRGSEEQQVTEQEVMQRILNGGY